MLQFSGPRLDFSINGNPDCVPFPDDRLHGSEVNLVSHLSMPLLGEHKIVLPSALHE